MQWLLTSKNLEEQVARWIQRLQEYNFGIRNCAGKVPSRRPRAEENYKRCNRLEEVEEGKLLSTKIHRTFCELVKTEE